MAAVKYQILSRYYNTNTNNAITNDSANEYEKDFIFSTVDVSDQITDEIINGNSPENIKTDMLFSYAGTRIVYPDKDKQQYYCPNLKYPYMIIDTYKRVSFSPWFVVHTCGSLESALEKAKMIVNHIGINNVKLIKVVPFDQKIKIK